MKSYVYHSATATAHALIEHLIAMMEREPEKTFYFAFSGGSTPSLMFDIWANEYKEVTPWMRMRIYWVDERCVPAEDYESNYGTMRRLLLDEVGMPDEYVYPIYGVNRCFARCWRRRAYLLYLSGAGISAFFLSSL